MIGKIYIVTVAALLVGVWGASGQQRAVVAGLEDNTEYRTLIDEEGVLVRTADSLATRIASLRRRLRDNVEGREAVSQEIVGLEERSFEIRSVMARLASRINTIEQEWILAGLLSTDEAATDTGGDGENVHNSPNLVYSSWFESELSPDELDELHGAQDAEGALPPLVAQYRAAHAQLKALAGEYGTVDKLAAADSIGTAFDDLAARVDSLAERIGGEWESIFDGKSYIYNLLADKGNHESLMTRFEEGMERLREERSRWQASGAPTAILDYVLQKRMLTDHELALAALINNDAAADSLRRITAVLPGPATLDDLAAVKLTERLFLDYADVAVGGSPYNAANPIPEVAVWPKGIIWRVQVGNFASRQSPAVFRGVHPLAVQRSGDGRFRYFAGGFPTDSSALAAVERLRKAGFRAPVATVWMDGVFTDPAATDETTYRIDISGAEELSPEIREVIASATETGGGGDIVRGGGAFIVTPLNGATAVKLRAALESLKSTHPGLEIKLSKISE